MGATMSRAMIILLGLPGLLCLLAAGCADRTERDSAPLAASALIAQDPVIARALHDPLMTDPDLASRNEANAMIGFADSGALPVIAATSADASAARAAMRLELLADGALPDLPPPLKAARGGRLGPMASAADLIAALGAPAPCAARLTEDFALAATMPPAAAIPPRAMVLQAAGAETKACRIRIIRFATPAAPEDVLQYHYARAQRAGLVPARHERPEDIIAATGKRGETLVVHVRPAPHGLTSVDLLYRAP